MGLTWSPGVPLKGRIRVGDGAGPDASSMCLLNSGKNRCSPGLRETKRAPAARLRGWLGRWRGSATMMGRGTATARLEIMAEQRAMPAEQFCGADSCEGLRVVSLDDENLCCDHFLSRCYALLERVDPRSGASGGANPISKKSRELVEYYSRRALEVSLGAVGLSNLQRARLLDILLWASDISAGGDSRAGSPWGSSPVPAQTKNSHPGSETEQDRRPGLPRAGGN